MAVWKIVLIVLAVVFIVVPLLAFAAQRAISPGSGHSSLGTTVETVKTTDFGEKTTETVP
jgi:predicted Na+-dependent transporter